MSSRGKAMAHIREELASYMYSIGNSTRFAGVRRRAIPYGPIIGVEYRGPICEGAGVAPSRVTHNVSLPRQDPIGQVQVMAKDRNIQPKQLG